MRKDFSFSRAGAFFSLVLSGIGAAYSGTLAYQKLTTGVCAFGTSCPFLFGVPVCVYGFFGFLIAHTLVGVSLFIDDTMAKKLWTALFWFSFGGVLFAVYYLTQELLESSIASPGFSFPSCLPGVVLFGIIFALAKQSLAHWGERNR